LPAKITLEVLGNLANNTLEGCLADEEVGTLLVPTDLSEGDGSRAVSVGLFDTSSGWGGLTSGLGGQLLAGSLSSCRLSSGLLGTGHLYYDVGGVAVEVAPLACYPVALSNFHESEKWRDLSSACRNNTQE
jgi:hypothetical protein